MRIFLPLAIGVACACGGAVAGSSILDDAEMLDWVRIDDGGYRFTDTVLSTYSYVPGMTRYGTLLKIDTNRMDPSWVLVSASLHLYILREPDIADLTIGYVSDDSWTSETDAGLLNEWPVAEELASVAPPGPGWLSVDVTRAFQLESGSAAGGPLSLKLYSEGGSWSERYIASPAYPVARLRPYVFLTYSGGAEPGMVRAYDDAFAFGRDWPVPVDAVTFSAWLRNVGSLPASVRASLCCGWEYCGGWTLSVPACSWQATPSADTSSLIPGEHVLQVTAVDQETMVVSQARRTILRTADPGFFAGDFEGVLAPWWADNDMPYTPWDGGQREWHLTPTMQYAHSGAWGVEGYLDGCSDDGSIWLNRRWDVPAQRRLSAEVTWWLYSEQPGGVMGWPALTYAGARPAEGEYDFDIVGIAGEKVGWQCYSSVHAFDSDEGQAVCAAFGFGATWETPHTYWLDDAEVLVYDTELGGAYVDEWNPGWHLISLPVQPSREEAGWVLADAAAAGNLLHNNLYRYSAAGYEMYPNDFTQMEPRRAYWLRLTHTCSHGLKGFADEGDADAPLASGWSMVGLPILSPADVHTCLVSNGDVTLSFDDAVLLGWIASPLYGYDGGYFLVPGDDDFLRPWQGYWVYSFVEGLWLVSPGPGVSQ